MVVVADAGEVIVPLEMAVHKPVPGEGLFAVNVIGEPAQTD